MSGVSYNEVYYDYVMLLLKCMVYVQVEETWKQVVVHHNCSSSQTAFQKHEVKFTLELIESQIKLNGTGH